MNQPQPNIPSPQGPPASPPVHRYLAQHPGPAVSADQEYVVLPRHLLAQLPPQLQHNLVQVLDQVQRVMSSASWPVWRVVPSRWAPIDELDERELAEAGVWAEIDGRGVLTYRDSTTGRALSDTETRRRVLVAVHSAHDNGTAGS